MTTINDAELLKDKDIMKEINRYKWLESEKSGADIGFERASREWINTCSKQYFSQHPGKCAALWLKSQQLYKVLNKKLN
jgi:hypothetical protein